MFSRFLILVASMMFAVACSSAPIERDTSPNVSPVAVQAQSDTEPQSQPSTLTEDDLALFAWRDSLALPAVGDAPYVRMPTGRGMRGDEHFTIYTYGFLLERNAETVTLLTSKFRHVDIPTQHRGGQGERYEPEALAFESYVRDRIAEIREMGVEEWVYWRSFRSARFDATTELVWFARVLHARGNDALARDLLEVAEACTGWREDANHVFRTNIELAMAEGMMWQAVLVFENPHEDFVDLRTRFAFIVEHFPASPHHERAVETLAMLDTMIEENAAHDAVERLPIAEMSEEERIAELIFQLRTQNGAQWMQPGSADIFLDSRGDDSPASQLLAIDLPAVPALIDILGDQRFTRTVGYFRDFMFSHIVLRYHAAAAQILSRMSGRRFSRAYAASPAMSRDEQVAALRQQVRQWYDRVRDHGMTALLAEGVRRGDNESLEQARRLREADPAAFLEAVREGIAVATSDWTRCRLTEQVAALETPEGLALLTDLAGQDHPILVRITAVTALLRREIDGSESLAAEVWTDLATARMDDWWSVRRGFEQLVPMTAMATSTAPIGAMVETYPRLSMEGRHAILEHVSDHSFNLDVETIPTNPRVAELLEDFLQTVLLEDTAQTHSSGSTDGISYQYPRLCDWAGHVLQKLWPERYEFHIGGTLRERDHQRALCANTGREAHDQDPLPVPELPVPLSIPRLHDSQVVPWLNALVSATNETTLGIATDALLELGLGALPAIRERLAETPSDLPAHTRLATVAAQVAMIVRTAEVGVLGSPLPADAQAALDALPGQPLTADAVIDLMRMVSRHHADTTSSLAVSVYRPGDGLGASIVVGYQPRTTERRIHWRRVDMVRVDRETTYRRSDSNSVFYFLRDEAHSRLHAAMTSAFSSPPEANVEVQLSLH